MSGSGVEGSTVGGEAVVARVSSSVTKEEEGNEEEK